MTVVVPVYNAREYIAEAVESVLAQTWAELDIIIIDDGSTDGSIDAIGEIRDPRLRLIVQRNRGKSAALNVAMREARGEYLAVNDADDISHPMRIERQVRALEAQPHLGAIFCGHELLLGSRRCAPQARTKSESECASDIAALRMPAHDPTALFRMAAVRGMAFDEALSWGEGLDFILRLGETTAMAVLGECLYTYRVHAASITRSSPQARDAQVELVLRRACERRSVRFEEARQSPVAPRRAGRRLPNRVLDNNIVADFVRSVQDQRRMGHRWASIKTGLDCARIHPADVHYWKALGHALLPRWAVQALSRR